jgi:hypothetical protein
MFIIKIINWTLDKRVGSSNSNQNYKANNAYNNNQGVLYFDNNKNNINSYSNNQNYNGNAQPSKINNQRPLEAWFDIEANANVNWNAWNNQYAYKSTSSLASCNQVNPASNLNLTAVHIFINNRLLFNFITTKIILVYDR